MKIIYENIDEWKEDTIKAIREYPNIFNMLLTDPRVQCESYFNGHFPKFAKGYEWMEKYLGKNGVALELGTPFPYYTWYLAKYHGWTTRYLDVSIQKPYIFPNNVNAFGCYGNIHTEDYGKDVYDLIVTSEIWEHLGSNLIETRDRIIRALKPNGYLFASFPMHGLNSDPSEWTKVLTDLINFDGGPHKREFNPDTYKKFIDVIPMIEDAAVNTSFYGHIQTCFYKKS